LERVHSQALTQGVILALGWDRDASIPLLVGPQGQWVYTPDAVLDTLCPFRLDLGLFWGWVKEESCRAAELWLVGQPYAPTVVLEEPPGAEGELRLARFTSVSPDGLGLRTLRGRPLGSGVFENRQAFLAEIRLAVARVNDRGKRVTQERVAEVLAQKALIGTNSPDRQLRRWSTEFGFSDWRNLLAHL
jgi:hypothetical protein